MQTDAREMQCDLLPIGGAMHKRLSLQQAQDPGFESWSYGHEKKRKKQAGKTMAQNP